jgi:hypothetical protein
MQKRIDVIRFFIYVAFYNLFSIFDIIVKRSLKLLRLSDVFVSALPMQYLLNPERLIRKSLRIFMAGEGTLPSRFNSMMATLSSLSRPSLFKWWNFKLKSIVSLSVLP